MSPILLAMLAAGAIDQETANRIERTTDPEALRVWAESTLQNSFGGALNAQQGRILDFLKENENPTAAQWGKFWASEDAAMWKATGGTLIDVATETAMLQATAQNLVDTFSFVNQQVTDWTTEYYTAVDKVGSLGQLNQTSRKQFADAFTSWRTGGLGDTAGRADGFPQLVRATAKVFGPERAERIAVTEATRIRAESQRQIEAGEESTTYFRWMTAADETVCEICGPLHGQIVAKSSRTFDHPILGAIEGPPAHVRCRCGITPETDLTAKIPLLNVFVYDGPDANPPKDGAVKVGDSIVPALPTVKGDVKIPPVIGEMPEWMQAEYNQAFSEVAKDYPFLSDWVKGFDVSRTDVADVAGTWEQSSNMLQIPRYQTRYTASEYATTFKNLETVGGGDFRTTIVHELGHAIDDYLKMGVGVESEIQDEYFVITKKLRDTISAASQYATTSRGEFIAEQFAFERTSGGDDIQSVFRQFIPFVKEKELKKILKERARIGR
jgi:SPP1 gp7 family putative phage head morphogenesis protein